MCVGLLAPAIIGGYTLTTLRQDQRAKDLDHQIRDKLELLAISLADPLWNIDNQAAGSILMAMMRDPTIVRIVVNNPNGREFLGFERLERRIGSARHGQRDILRAGAVVGRVEVEFDDGLSQRAYQSDRMYYVLVLASQFAVALALMLFVVRRRVLQPLARLRAFSDQIAKGDLHTQLDWARTDEIGHLARQLDHMRSGLKASFEEQQVILENIQVGVIFVRDHIIRLANRHVEEIFGYAPGEMHGQMSHIIYHSTHQFEEIAGQATAAVAEINGVYEGELNLKRRNGSGFWAHMRGRALDHTEPHAGSIWVFEDVTEQHRAAAQLRLSATVFENTADGVMITDSQRHIVAVNRSFERITGYGEAEVLGHSPSFLHSGRQGHEFYAQMWRTLEETRRWSGELWNRRKTGEIYPEHLTITAVLGAKGELDHYVSVFSDITFRKEAESEITKLAFYDFLTQLPNRRLMLDRLTQALASSARHQRHGALMLIDLDNFKTLNDTLGHDVGDQLLVRVAARLESCVREGDTVARLGGDEFVVILEGLDKDGAAPLQAEAVAQKVLFELKKPYLLDLSLTAEHLTQRSHDCTASLGIAMFRDQSISVDELMKRADTAMYQAKAAGRNALRFFDPDMQLAVAARAALELDLRRGLLEKQFLLYFQSQVDSSNCVIGAEVLLRWQHPERGLVSPIEFIPLAEETGLILPLGQWVLEAACAQLAVWADRPGFQNLTLAVNVSARQFRQADFVQQVLAALNQFDANPGRLKLELTESMLVDNVEDVIEKMKVLKQRGVNFSMDDFGTGYSSLLYLKLLPIDQLKIDRSFVRDVLTDLNDAAIARTIVALGQSLGLSVIAEGVETQVQRDFLAANGCDLYQGYFFSRPFPLDDFTAYVNHSQSSVQHSLS